MLRLIARFGVWTCITLIHAYQMVLAPMLIGGCCRHHPTCSQFAIEALNKHGLRRGGLMALRRIGRCRPGGTFGYDPVP